MYKGVKNANFIGAKGRYYQPRFLLARLEKKKKKAIWSLSCEYLRKFSKKSETVLMEYSGAGGKLIHEKNQKQKIS